MNLLTNACVNSWNTVQSLSAVSDLRPRSHTNWNDHLLIFYHLNEMVIVDSQKGIRKVALIFISRKLKNYLVRKQLMEIVYLQLICKNRY